MTRNGADRKPKIDWRAPKLDFGWLRRLVSWKTIIVAMAALGCAAGLFVVAGGVDVSADKPDGWLATHALHFVFKRSEAAGSRRVTAPNDLASASRVRLAAQHFDMVCANCHGRPGFGQSVVALSMNPRPQYLPKVVGQFTNAELYVIVEHGVKYSAMPSWATDARGDEVWSMVAFLRQLPKLDAKAYRDMTALPTKAEGAPAGPMDGDAGLRPANARRNTPPVDEFLYAAPATGFYDPTIGDMPAATCARCHGADGSGAVTGGEAPNLTLQDARYLHAALDAYTSGARKSGFMQTIAAELSAQQITALSAYYAGLPVKTAPSSPADPALLKRGEAIATQGIRERAIPACANCHDSAGSQVVGAPHIAGQSATFLRRQLTAMAHGGRGSAVAWNPMSDVAHALDDKDIAALAAYYSGLNATKATASGQHLAPGPQQAVAVPAKMDMQGAKAIFDTTCTKCHINDGRGDRQGDYPNLTILTTAYAAQSLYTFHTGARLSGKMREVTDSLTLDQMTSLAGYLNSLAPRPALAKPDASAAVRGEAIATHGIAGVPACLNCHSAKGISALPLIPPLQGQSVGYLLRKLDYFTKPYPVNDNALNPMPAIARQLTDQQRADLAAYFAAASPLEKPSPRP